jgi:hypothetical protein
MPFDEYLNDEEIKKTHLKIYHALAIDL